MVGMKDTATQHLGKAGSDALQSFTGTTIEYTHPKSHRMGLGIITVLGPTPRLLAEGTATNGTPSCGCKFVPLLAPCLGPSGRLWYSSRGAACLSGPGASPQLAPGRL